MQDETKRDLVKSGSGLVGALLEELIVHRQRIDVLEQRKEAELEVARVRSSQSDDTEDDAGESAVSADAASPSAETTSTDDRLAATPAEIEEALDELIEDEMCDVCRELLVALKERPAKEQVRGVMEYGTFKQNLSDGAGVDELKATIRETTILHDIFQEKYTGPGAEA